MSNFRVLKSETRIGYVTEEQLKTIHDMLIEKGAHVEDVRLATCRGYISRKTKKSYLCVYDGRFGVGYTLRQTTNLSTTYCNKEYILLTGLNKEQIEEIINNVLLIDQTIKEEKLHEA